jgi:hypothetical protein
MRRSIAPLLAVVTLLALVSAPATLAKEWLEARVDAPIAMGTPGGTEILVGISVVAPDPESGGMHPVEGSPMYVKLTGPDGATTRAAAAADRVAGHYTARIVIPEGGARGIEIGIHGTSDLPIMLMNEPFAFGPISARTAQLAPLLATAAPVKPAAPVAPPAREPLPAAAPAPVASPALLAGLLALTALAVGASLVARRRRAAATAPRSA